MGMTRHLTTIWPLSVASSGGAMARADSTLRDKLAGSAVALSSAKCRRHTASRALPQIAKSDIADVIRLSGRRSDNSVSRLVTRIVCEADRRYLLASVYLFAFAVVGLMVGLVTALFAGCQTMHGYGPAALIGTLGGELGFMAGRALHINGAHDSLGFCWSALGAGVVAWLWCWAVRRHRL